MSVCACVYEGASRAGGRSGPSSLGADGRPNGDQIWGLGLGHTHHAGFEDRAQVRRPRSHLRAATRLSLSSRASRGADQPRPGQSAGQEAPLFLFPRVRDKQGSTCCESWASVGLLDEPLPGETAVSEPRVHQGQRGQHTCLHACHWEVCAEMRWNDAC